jgi:hypothetical protein
MDIQTLEDLFLNCDVRRTGRNNSWPYQSIDVLDITHKDEYRDIRDVYKMLSSKVTVNDSLKEQLNTSSRTSMDPVMVDDLEWRAKHLGLKTDFWSDVRADIPYQLTEVNAIEYPSGPLDGPCPLSSPILQQTLWENAFYKNAQLVRNPFRCFHRSDGQFPLLDRSCAYPSGVLLTMSPDLGVDYLDKNLGEYLNYPRDRRIESEEASVLGFMWKRFRTSGTHAWHKPTVEWFLVYLLTELAATPHTIRQGRNSVSLISAYQQVVQDLVRKVLECHIF